MRVKDENGRILSSENPVIIGMWKKAGYSEVSGDNEPPKGGEPQDGEAKKSRKKTQE